MHCRHLCRYPSQINTYSHIYTFVLLIYRFWKTPFQEDVSCQLGINSCTSLQSIPSLGTLPAPTFPFPQGTGDHLHVPPHVKQNITYTSETNAFSRAYRKVMFTALQRGFTGKSIKLSMIYTSLPRSKV